MSRRQEVRDHQRSLGEIREVLGSMKNLSLMESHRLAQALESQERVVGGIAQAARDLLAAHPELRPCPDRELAAVWLVLGSERGFCGDYNSALAARAAQHDGWGGRLIAVGGKLAGELHLRGLPADGIEGPTALEEVYPVLRRLTERLGRPDLRGAPLSALCHLDSEGNIGTEHLLPPFRDLPAAPRPATAPLLYLPPPVLHEQLVDHYLLAALLRLLYRALLLEHQRRVRHLEGTVRRLDEKVAALRLRADKLRQEEITEELQVILLSGEGWEGMRPGHPPGSATGAAPASTHPTAPAPRTD